MVKKLTVVAFGGRGLAGEGDKGFSGVLRTCAQYPVRDMEYAAVCIGENSARGTLEICTHH